jgi:hypothetical protein
MSKPCNKRRLVADVELHDAALWRLDGWSQSEIEVATAPLAWLVQMCPELDSSYRSVKAMLPSLHRPGDRRDPWTALCALVCLWAYAHDDLTLFYRAGVEVLTSYRQAMHGHKKPAPDALDELMASYLRRHPATTAMQLFEHCKSLAVVRMVVEDADDASLTYRTDPNGSKLKTVKQHAFEVRVSRIRKSLTAAPCVKRTAPANRFHWPKVVQPVVVSCTA